MTHKNNIILAITVVILILLLAACAGLRADINDLKDQVSIQQDQLLNLSYDQKWTMETLANWLEAWQTSQISIDQDLYLLAQLVHAEAGGEPLGGQIAVANVVMNRVKSDQFPGTIAEVIYQPGQFCTTKYLHNVVPTEENLAAAREAMGGYTLVNALYFWNPKVAMCEWIKTRKILNTIGNHAFGV
ncbi:cell wall hydrolase SleB [Syntrophobotulus glycolicus DSM 8271]|uniref:Cell wall hydrolase SleB n=1 Tax=Syntrophobotulus glycolicus (strain DSM 8271 / FlGlyR) TaxID=645991 RepID=F0SXD7_SYNGF|nr:cell wall hydrolase [Syntrophobotulus glycolicus]ADY54683.1 cell wall hydrolase SleB [Syntrophobotulus glycolicus DSM 8271]